MLTTFLTLLGVLGALLALPFVLVVVTTQEHKKKPQRNSAVAFYRRYPQLLQLRRKLSGFDVEKWHFRIGIFCMVLAVITISAAGYFPEDKRVEAVFKSYITLGGAYLLSYCLVSIKRGKTTDIPSSRYRIIYRHQEPGSFWFHIGLQFCIGFVFLFATQV